MYDSTTKQAVLKGLERTDLEPMDIEDTRLTKGKKTFRIGAVKIPIPFAPVTICVDLTVRW